MLQPPGLIWKVPYEMKKVKKAFGQCKEIASSASILDLFVQDLERLGVSGEVELAKLLFLTIVSRYQKRPVSVAIKGPSAGGKSYLIECVLRFFPSPLFINSPAFRTFPCV